MVNPSSTSGSDDDDLQAELIRRERYLRAIADMQRALSRSSSPDLRDLSHVLEPLGRASNVSRVYLFENHTDPSGHLHMSQRAEWCADGIQPEIDNPELQNLSYDEFFPRWAEVLAQGAPICDVVSEMPASERQVLDAQDIRSILVLPLVVQGGFIGFIGFDDCVSDRRWDELEVDLLSAAATNVGLFLDQRRVRTDLELTNDALTQARDEVLRAMQARSVFLAKVSHELRTPLNAIIGYAELVLDDARQGAVDGVEDDVGRILGSGRYLLSMVDDLLTLTQLGTGETPLHASWVDLDPWLDGLLEMWLHPRADLGTPVRVERPATLGRAYTDPRRLQQVVINLLSNAIKYTPDGDVVLRAVSEPDGVTIAVDDTGVGMTPDHVEHIFDEFYQADPSCRGDIQGVGLGLPITRRLCDVLGAQLLVRSELGKGSCFTVQLPRRQVPA